MCHSDLYLIKVYLLAYKEAVDDFEEAVKDVGYADLALEAVQRKYAERVDRVGVLAVNDEWP